MSATRRFLRRGAWAAALVAVGAFYVVAAAHHAGTVNDSKARGDQSGYLWDAEILYHDWHGGAPPRIVERNRMPLYGAFLALFYDPAMSDADFFVLGRKLNIGLSVVLLAILGLVFARFLPPLVATNLALFVAFGYFVFKAGYVQSELLFYFLFFLAFLACCSLFTPRRPRAALALGAACGGLLALAHLTKAAMLPFVVLFLATYLGTQLARAIARVRSGCGAWSALRERLADVAAAILVLATFLAVLAPYLVNSKRVFGRYFYNVNSTFYVWYDDWGKASVGTYRHGDHVGWPDVPASELPSASRYWREHSLAQIAARIANGFADMAVRSYRTFWYLEYLVVFAGLAAWLIWQRWRDFVRLVQDHAGLAVFLALYACTFLVFTAFYNPTSGTGTTRFLLAHVAPAAFLVSRLSSLPPFDRVSATVAGVEVTTRHLHLLVSVMLAFDIAFTIWPRLMTTYGGF